MSAPLLGAILKYCRESRYQFHIPGHNKGEGMLPEFRALAPELFKMDLTEVPGLDDLHNPGGVIAGAQERAARLYGADETFFLVNGTSCGLQALVMSAAQDGERVLVPRNAHRSVLGGLILSGAVPVYIQPEIIPFFDFPAGISPGEVEEKITAYPGIKGVLVVHPTYYGTAGNLAGIAEKAHEREIPVLADEAHGPHFYFHRDFPRGALEKGADAAVQSVHKTAGSLTQSSWLHVKGPLLNREKLKSSLQVLQSTSPSYILMSSLDAAREQMEKRGAEIMERLLEHSDYARREIEKIRGLRLLDKEQAGQETDPARLVISVKKAGFTGFTVKEILSAHYRVEIEMADFNNIVAVLGPGTSRGDIDMLIAALNKICSGGKEKGVGVQHLAALPPIPPQELSPRQAWMSAARTVDLDEAGGLVSAETVSIYPPGIPALCPGEIITREVIEYLHQARSHNLHCQGPQDPALKYIRVIE